MPDRVTETRATALTADEGEVLDVFGASMAVKADPALHGMFLGDHRVPPGFLVPPHVHQADAEVFFVLEGELTLLLPEGERRIGPGGAARLPAGSRHGFRNDGAAEARFLVASSPGLQNLEMFRHFDRAGRSSPGGLTPPEIVAICGEYGVTMG